ncbi:MAG: CheB methylesterase domain-containing protein, partial [Myxococcota bacterium]
RRGALRKAPRTRRETKPKPEPLPVTPLRRLVCVGASTGGPPALESLFRAVGSFDGTAFLVSQHMPSKFTKAFAERINRISPMQIVEAEAGMPVSGSWVYVAPGGRHMGAKRTASGGLQLTLESPKQGDRYVPSIDHMFQTVAAAASVPILAVVLTGMGADGALGIRDLHKSGAVTVAESQESSIVFGMPNEAIQTGCVDEILHLDAIIERVHRFAGGPA